MKERPLTGSEKWQNSEWQELLALTLPALRELPSHISWSLGGGTALSLSIDHRVSFDIDIFFENSEALRLLHPNNNSTVKGISTNFQYPGHRIRLERNEGEIDFLIAFHMTDNPVFMYEFQNSLVPVETASEIIAKKLNYRGSKLTVRDAFDLLAVCEYDRDAFHKGVSCAQEGARRAVDRIQRVLSRRYREDLNEEIKPTERGRALFDFDISRLESELDGLISSGYDGGPK